MCYVMLFQTPSPTLYKASITDQNGFSQSCTTKGEKSENSHSVLQTPNAKFFHRNHAAKQDSRVKTKQAVSYHPIILN